MADILGAFDAIRDAFNSLDFRGKLRVAVPVELNMRVSKLVKYDGYLKLKTGFAVERNEGEHYVYMWKHMRGDVFYIGSGKGNRCISKYRKASFLKHIDKGDSIVYIVLNGVSKETALFYERYLSLCFSDIGQPIVNKDNNATIMGKDKVDEWLSGNKKIIDDDFTKSIEDVILNKILCDKDFTYEDMLAKEYFIKENGCDYFSRGRWKYF